MAHISNGDRPSPSEQTTKSSDPEHLSSINPDLPGPMIQSPTAQRLSELLSAWLPNSSEGIYHQYLQSLSPAYDHLLTYSRYDRIWRFSHLSPHEIFFRSQISSTSSPVHVIYFSPERTTASTFDGTDQESMDRFKRQLASDHQNPDYLSSRVVCAQHLTCLSMEALGSGLSVDPNVLSHQIGMAFKAIEQDTSLDRLENSGIRVNTIPTSVGVYERDRNLQIVRNHLGRLQFKNVEYARDLTVRDSVLKSVCNRDDYPMTISVDIPRTVYVQGYQSDEDRTNSALRRLSMVALGLQDGVLSRRSARRRFADDSMLCDQGESYTQYGLDILQHVTIHVKKNDDDPGNEEVVVLFPPYPELDKDNDPCIFLDPLRREEITETFQDFCEGKNTNRHGPREQLATDPESRICDLEIFSQDVFADYVNTIRGPERVLDLVRSYAINAWFDRLQNLENQLQDLNIEPWKLSAQDAEGSQQNRGVSDNEDSLLNGKGMVNTILRYIASLDLELHRLRIDLRSDEGYDEKFPYMELRRMMGKYTFIRSRMASLLTQAQNLLGVKVTDIPNPAPPRHNSMDSY
ncbi:hypothetical protein N7452_001335 [Penicillium brevicompactum]|uniref:Uncharacterized protein n=1 Tax=Penicillium brevicompactum TaxID=5074 RepID=A0A9W9URR1_PENBR|nr:hypothetical protein N7452_001335 [Penicillium brevicompactum]